MYSAKLGLKTQQQRLDVIASNVANVDTVGYKRQSALFKDALYTQMMDPSNVSSNENLKQGSGVILTSTQRSFVAGTPVQTGEALDLYIDGDGFFTVEAGDGNVMYTRGGSFKLSTEEDGQYIVTPDGSYLLDSEGERIRIPEGSGSISVSSTGQMVAGDTAVAALRLVTFTNKDGLSLTGSGCYEITEASGGAIASDAGIKQGYLESSNVDMSIELTQMIRAQRAFSLAGKALTTWNEMESVTNNLRT
jgi:flagellar basal-body rod protein FlgG